MNHLHFFSYRFLPEACFRLEFFNWFKSLTTAPSLIDVFSFLEENQSKKIQKTNLKNIESLAEKSFQLASQKNISAVSYWCKNYPELLKSLPDPPIVLFYRGMLPKSKTPSLAIVGSRVANSYSFDVIESVFCGLQNKNLQTISGLALGADSIAHLSSLKNKIPTFAVLGSSVEEVTPKSNQYLEQKILEQEGGILSEYPPYYPCKSWNFPVRNRIISGLSHLVWVIQGTEKSGSLHTVKHALDQGRTVITTPGSVFSELSMLPHRLIAEGADIVCRSNDLDTLLEKNCRF